MKKYNILLVDDEESILKALKRTLHREGFNTILARNTDEAWKVFIDTPVHLVVCDYRMPGVSGVEFFKILKEKFPDIIRILLTGQADLKSTIEAINYGGIYKFLLKPWNDDDLVYTIKLGLEYYGLKEENRELLKLTQEQNRELVDLNENLEDKIKERTSEIEEKNKQLEKVYAELQKNFVEMIRGFAGLIEMRDSSLGFHSKRVAAFAKSTAQQMNLSRNEISQIEIAAILHDIGKIGISDPLMSDSRDTLSNKERKLINNHPVVGQSCVQTISNLENVGKLIRHHHEYYDGTGYPDGLESDLIPLGSRIIAVADSFDRLTNKQVINLATNMGNPLKSLKLLAGSKLDPLVVNEFIESVNRAQRKKSRTKEMIINIHQLREGMVLSRDLYTVNKILLIARDEIVGNSHILKIKNFSMIDPIEEGIYVYIDHKTGSPILKKEC